MARLASQARGGFYAAHPDAVAAVLARLRPPTIGDCTILDPCAGEAAALLQLATGLNGIPYGIELSEDRAQIVRAALPEGQSLCPADFLRTMISTASFSLAWVNPPYDFATGGEGRVEVEFLKRAARLVVTGGVLALVAPEDVCEDVDTQRFFDEHFDRVSAMKFPAAVRKYNETVILGVKRKEPAKPEYAYDWLNEKLLEEFTYYLPPGERPKMWRKSEPTDTELVRLVAQSPLRFAIDRPAQSIHYKPRPPLSPGIGHRAMLLASGHVDGLICPPGEKPHVIRGTVAKEQFVSSCTSDEDSKGNVTVKTVTSERPKFIIRVLDSMGAIHDLE